MRVVVARVDEFPVDSRRIVKVGGREIGVFRVAEDRFYALRNRCPHQGGPLCQGRYFPRIVSDVPGEVALADGPPLLVCPWHGWQYDMSNGQSYVPDDRRVGAYTVSVEPGRRIEERGPYVVETFPVRTEEEYVVLEA